MVELRRVSFSFQPHTAPRAVLDRIDLVIAPRDFMGIIGPNGGGKTTLLRIILGLLAPQEGSVRVLGQSPAAARRWVGYVPQRAAVNLSAPASALDVVLMGRLGRGRWGFRYSRADRAAAMDALDCTGMASLCDRPIADLSGGQRQRVLIARALCSDAQLLLLDEPTAGVDVEAERSLTELLHQLNARLAVVVVSHDIAFVSTQVRTVACLNRTLSIHKPQDVTGETLAAMYGGDVRLVDHHGHCHSVEGA
ncbi:MAG: metal ABC transporter ATP-binding protein [Phycisphaerales bacterium]|nr:metal ABC transporter ATP-binding protein [Phycisphaerales bacterium]